MQRAKAADMETVLVGPHTWSYVLQRVPCREPLGAETDVYDIREGR